MGWEFAALLGGALIVSLLLGLWQQGRYARSVNELATRYRGKDRLLVTGRGLGKLKGAIVMLIVDDPRDEVIAAHVLRGTTIFATAKEAPELVGPIVTLLDRVTDKQSRKAVEMALTQLKATRARVADSKVNSPRRPAGTAKRKVQA